MDDKEYLERLLELGSLLEVRIKEYQASDKPMIPSMLIGQAMYLCGYIDALREPPEPKP